MKDTISKRIDAVTEIQTEYLGAVLPIPKSVKIELTSRCNFQCTFCANRHRDRHGLADMDWKLYTKVVNEMADAGVKELGVFYIGESFMCDWLPEAISYAKRAGIPYVFLTTNGFYATPHNVEAVMKAGLDSLKFSLNNSDPNQFRQVTGMAASGFERVLDHIKSASKIRNDNSYKTRIYASSIKYDGIQQSNMEKVVERIRPYVDEHYWLPLYTFGDQAKMEGGETVGGNPGRLDAMRPPMPCWAVFKEGHITHDGKLSACCFDSDDKWTMADLNQVRFTEGWNSLSYQILRQAHLKKDVHGTPCEGCIHGVKN